MKKFLSGLIAAFMLAAGLVAFSGQSAQAACGDQYTPCVATKVKVQVPKKVVAKKKSVVKVQVTANGNVKPIGVLHVTVNGKKHNYNYKGGKLNVRMPKLKPGKYKVTIKFTPAKVANFKPSTTKFTLKVTKPKPKKKKK